MKMLLCVLLGGIAGAVSLAVEPIDRHQAETTEPKGLLGASYAEVVAQLGEPDGSGRFDGRLLLSYARGTVLLVDGKVTQVSLMDEAVWHEQQERKRAEALARANAAHEALQTMLASPHFAEASLETRVRRWTDYRKRWPEFDLPAAYDEDMLAWRERMRSRHEQAARDARVIALERRVAEAEWAARDAERKADEARLAAERNQNRHRFTLGTTYYSPPIIHGNVPYYYPYSSRDHSHPRQRTEPTPSPSTPERIKENQPRIQHRPFNQVGVKQ